MIKGLESLLHNSRFTSAQHVTDNRTTADVRLHNSCCAADDTISFRANALNFLPFST